VFSVGPSDELFLGTAALEGALGEGLLSSTLLVPISSLATAESYIVRADDNGYGVEYVIECDESNNSALWPD